MLHRLLEGWNNVCYTFYIRPVHIKFSINVLSIFIVIHLLSALLIFCTSRRFFYRRTDSPSLRLPWKWMDKGIFSAQLLQQRSRANREQARAVASPVPSVTPDSYLVLRNPHKCNSSFKQPLLLWWQRGAIVSLTTPFSSCHCLLAFFSTPQPTLTYTETLKPEWCLTSGEPWLIETSDDFIHRNVKAGFKWQTCLWAVLSWPFFSFFPLGFS